MDQSDPGSSDMLATASTPLVHRVNPHNDEATSRVRQRGRVGIIFGITFGITFAMVLNHLSNQRDETDGTQLTSSAAAASESTSLHFRVENKYTRRNQRPTGTAYPWIESYRLAEPHTASDFVATGICTDCEAHWTVSKGSDFWREFDGDNVTMILERIGTYNVTLEEKTSTGAVLRSVTGSVLCRFVRREIRSLFDEDREAFFTAARKMWEYGPKEGQRRYGSDYTSISEITSIHTTRAAQHSHDYMHDGLGTLTNHVCLTWLFEQSLRSIDPALSVPYWDFTIESTHIDLKYGGDLGKWLPQAEVFKPDIFGWTNASAGFITEGRWGYLDWRNPHDLGNVTTNVPHQLGAIRNAYGLIRGRYNLNPIPYVSRFTSTPKHWPVCHDYYKLLANEGDNFFQFGWNCTAPLDVHGYIHVVLGGHSHFDLAYRKLTDLGVSPIIVEALAFDVAFSLGQLWRSELMVFPAQDSCVGLDDCRAYCPNLEEKLAAGDADSYLFTIYPPSDHRQTGVNVYKELVLSGNYSYATRAAIVELYCDQLSTTKFGDMNDMSAANDISFWPTHPLLERLYQFKALSGTLASHVWPTSGACYSPNPHPYNCTGHLPDDPLPFKGLLGDLVAGGGDETWYTGRRILELINPAHDHGLPYIFDGFDYPHCEALGFDFRSLLDGPDSIAGDTAPSAWTYKPEW